MWRKTYIVRYGVDRLLDYTGYLLRTAFVRAAAISAREFGEAGHPRDVGVLATLDALGPRSQQELATGLSVNRTVMVKLIDGLEARGFVERVRNPHDRRAYALHATPAGLEYMAAMLPRMLRAEAELTADLSAGEHERLNALLLPLIAPRRRRSPSAPGSCCPRPTTASTTARTRCSSPWVSRCASSGC